MTTKKTVTIERTYPASIEDVWELWTTKDGIESWWGPDGFTVTVSELELRVGGVLRYTMTATGPMQVDFMKRAGMPLASEVRCRFSEIAEPRRLAFTTFADFIPGVPGYDVGTVVELRAEGAQVKLVLTLDAMHDETWTQRAVMGWENELGKLGKALEAKQ